MAPSRKKGRRATAAAALNQWKIGDLVLAKLKGFPAWPAEVSEPEKWGYSSDRKKLLVYFYGTKQIAFCNYADIEAFTEEKKKSLLVKRQGKGADFVRAVEEIIDAYEKKYKSNLVTSDDEGHNSQSGHLEGSKSKSARKSPEINLESDNNNQSAHKLASDNHDAIAFGGVPQTSAEVDYPQSTNTSNDEPIENMQTLSTTRTTKKRTRNGSLQSHVIQRLPSRRRSKNSSGDKVQKSSMAEDFTHEAVCEFNSNVSQESSLKKLSSCNGVPSSDCSVENVSDRAAVISDAEKINKLRSNCKLGISNEIDSVNGKLDHLTNNKAPIEKKKRNSNRKQTTNALDCETVGNGTESDTKLHVSPCKSPNCSKEVVENFIKADGDEHLPLVKRARVRMGKQSLEETPLAEDIESRDNEVVVSPMEESSSCPNKVAAISSPVADCTHVDTEDSVNWKVNKFQSEGLSLDIEAALPPSKRLHRALEAMSANAAESTNITDDVNYDKHSIFPKKDPLIISDNATNCDNAAESTNITDDVNYDKHSIFPKKDPLIISDNATNCDNAAESTNITDDVNYDKHSIFPKKDPLIISDNATNCENAAESTNITDDVNYDKHSIFPKKDPLIISDNATNCDNAAESTNITDGVNYDNDSNFPKKDPIIISDNATNCDIICDTHSHSPEKKLPNIFGNGIIQSPNESMCIHSSNIASDLSSKGKPANAQCLRSPQIKEKCIDSCINKVLSSDNRETILQPCSSKPVKELIVATANECMPHQLSPLVADEKKIATLESSIGCSTPQSEPIIKKSDYVTNTDNTKFLPATKPAVMNISSTTSNTSGSAKSPSSQSDENTRASDMLNVNDDTYTITQRDWSFSDSTPMKDLIAAAQKRRLLSRSTSFSYTGLDGKEFGDSLVSPLGYNKSDSSGPGSPGNYRLHHRPATDDRAHNLQNVNRSPFLGRQSNGVNKSTSGVEARKSFEALLSTLSRTKDSIGRGTRMAIDCAKYGIAGEVIESLLQHLEKESSMHKRVDLFFLVDSIVQFSRSQKGGTGDMYPSIVLPALPRLLSAAAPHGNTAWENRRQCLKVLKLWLDRKTFPESTIRHYIRELESKNEASLPTYSRRQARTERSLDDPIREMEGMLVDEYGSNTSFHLQNFIHPPLREDGEGSSDDEKSFEAVTPEYNNTEAENDEKTTSTRTPNNEKVHHILAEVDGELEMEDVAPPCVVEQNETSGTVAPPLPQVLPPSPPPLPSSPPPLPPLAPQCQFVSPPNNYYRHAYGGLQNHMPPPPPRPMYSGNNFQHKTSPSLPHKPYHLQPPPPSVSNQFSYIQADTRPRSWDTNSYGDRFEYAKNRPQTGTYYSDKNTRRPNRHDSYDEGERFSPAINKGPSYSDKSDALYRYSPYSEHTSSSSHGWSNTSRISNYSAQEYPNSRVNRGRAYWQPR